LRRILRSVKSKLLKSGMALFPQSQAHVRKLWAKSQARVGITRPHPLHTLRHSKPSADARPGVRSLEEIRRMGRWSQLKSVQRYSKAHAITMHRASLHGTILTGADRAEATFPQCLTGPLRTGPTASHPLAKIILGVFESKSRSR